MPRGITRSRCLSDDREGKAALWTETKYGEVVIERSHPRDAEPAHHSKARSINDGKVLIFIRESNLPGDLQIRHADRLYFSAQARWRSSGDGVMK
jgi:hypothetical protein